MNFLQLCQRTRQECDISGTGPSAVTNQTGELKRVVDWVKESYDEICSEYDNWKFLRSEFSLNTVVGQEAYMPTDCTDTQLNAAIGAAAVGKFGRWILETFFIYLQSAGSSTRQNFWPTTYEHFRQTYQMQPPANGKPAFFAVRPRDYALLLGPKPDAVYVISGEYYRVAPPLSANDDVPLFPERFHLAIVWRAAKKYAGFEADGGLYVHAQNEHDKYYGPLMLDQLPAMDLGAPLA